MFWSIQTAGAYRTAEIDFRCSSCRHTATLSIAVEAATFNPFSALTVQRDDRVPRWLERSAERQAERDLRFARAMAECPRCGARSNPATHAWLVVRVILLGLTLGLVAAIAGLMAAVFLGIPPTGAFIVVGVVVGAIVACIAYRRRTARVDRWTTFSDRS